MDTDIELNCKGVLGTREHNIQHPVTSHRVPWYEEQVVNITHSTRRKEVIGTGQDRTGRDGTGRDVVKTILPIRLR